MDFKKIKTFAICMRKMHSVPNLGVKAWRLSNMIWDALWLKGLKIKANFFQNFNIFSSA